MSGKWYVEVDCARCGEPIPLGEVPSPEEEPEVKFRTVADVPCPACGYRNLAGYVARGDARAA